MKKLILVVTVLALSTVLTGCQTISGFGKDLQNAGSAITDAAK